MICFAYISENFNCLQVNCHTCIQRCWLDYNQLCNQILLTTYGPSWLTAFCQMFHNNYLYICIYIYIYNLIYLPIYCLCQVFVAVALWAFSTCSERGLPSSCDAWASHYNVFSCCRAWALGHRLNRCSSPSQLLPGMWGLLELGGNHALLHWRWILPPGDPSITIHSTGKGKES